MAHIFNEIIKKFRDENIVGKYIYITAAIYITIALAGVIATLFNSVSPVNEFVSYFELPADLSLLLYRPWSLVTYMFLHASVMHILWNMLALYVFGRIFLNFYSTRHFVGVYFLGGIIGGIFFILAYNIFPYFQNDIDTTYLVGASAAVLAIVTAAAVRSPNYTVTMLLFGNVRLATLAIITVLLSLLLLASQNAGGNFAHLGGAVAGWLFALMLGKGHDLTSIINSIIDFFSNSWNKIAKTSFKRPKMRATHTGVKHSMDHEYNARRKEQEEQINHILEKIKKSGYSSLTDEEKKRLFDASNR